LARVACHVTRVAGNIAGPPIAIATVADIAIACPTDLILLNFIASILFFRRSITIRRRVDRRSESLINRRRL